MASNRERNLLLDRLEIGQTLIGVEHYGFSRTTHKMTPYRITKKTKTRLVINLLREVEGALVPTDIELRFIARDGVVTTKVEGRGDRYGLDLHTEDDAKLSEYRHGNETTELRNAAVKSVERARNYFTRESAKAAIVALQAWVDAVEDDE